MSLAGLFGMPNMFAAAQAQAEMQQRARELQCQIYQQAQQNALAGFGQMAVSAPLTIHRDKCDGCGSREFTTHRGQVVCSYCRSNA